MLKEHLELQETFQSLVLGENWRNHISYPRLFSAFSVELAELLNSIGFKWWTLQIQDWNNAMIEVVDAYHFYLILILKSYPIPPHRLTQISQELERGFIHACNYTRDVDSICETIMDALDTFHKDSLPACAYHIGELIAETGFQDLHEFDVKYRAKMQINIDRQKKGYKHDEKAKYLEDGREDNELIK